MEKEQKEPTYEEFLKHKLSQDVAVSMLRAEIRLTEREQAANLVRIVLLEA